MLRRDVADKARKGTVGRGWTWQGRLGGEPHGIACSGKAVEVWHGVASPGMESRGGSKRREYGYKKGN